MCGDGHHIMQTRMSEFPSTLVEGGVVQAGDGYALASFSLSEFPLDRTIRVLGFFSIDHGPPTMALMSTPGQVENIMVPSPSVGNHEATTGTFYLYPDGHAEQKEAFNDCLLIAPRR